MITPRGANWLSAQTLSHHRRRVRVKTEAVAALMSGSRRLGWFGALRAPYAIARDHGGVM
jgi:hypothetical protein